MADTFSKQAHMVSQYSDQSLRAQVELFVETSNRQAAEGKVGAEQYWLISVLCDPDIGSEFRNSLSRAQLTSHNLLQEWISLQTTDKSSDVYAKAAMVRAKAEQGESRGDAESISAPGPRSYHDYLAELFRWEFTPPSVLTPPALYHAILQQQRRDAAVYASCYRMASGYYEHISTKDRDDETLSMSYIYELPFDPCPWLEQHTESLASLPFYLWDIQKRRTVEVGALILHTNAIPEYVAISHTWGRWVEMSSELVQIDGVPWKIFPKHAVFCA